MKLIVGLGNPGPEYERTRHNVGFVALDRIARRLTDPATGIPRSRFSGLVIESERNSEKLLLLKPTNFMNLSGTSVSEAIRFYKLDPEHDLLVLVDDIALPCGSIRLRAEGGDGGHNGLSDISQKLGTKRWARCRIGIDSRGRIPQKSYVLGRFTPEQEDALEPALEDSVRAATHWVDSGIAETMNRFNKRNVNAKTTEED